MSRLHWVPDDTGFGCCGPGPHHAATHALRPVNPAREWGGLAACESPYCRRKVEADAMAYGDTIVNPTPSPLAAIRAQAKVVADHLEGLNPCPWCGGHESVGDDGAFIFGDIEGDGCALADLLMLCEICEICEPMKEQR